MKKVLVIVFIISIILILGILILNIPKKEEYANSDFNIATYISSIDKDGDGIDDQTEILDNAKQYVKTKPKYQSKYYASGYPDDEYGVCTDVVAFALKDAISKWRYNK